MAVCPGCGAEFDLLCPRCEAVLPPDADLCPGCGLAFGEAIVEAAPVEPSEETRPCPTCGEPIHLPEGFCRECGQELCPRCGEGIAEEDDSCPHCHLALYFDCPLCGFELTAGTEVCPSCQALFPRHCTACGLALADDFAPCLGCGQEPVIAVRPPVSVAHIIAVQGQNVRLISCPGCSRPFDPRTGDCPQCAVRVCPICQLALLDTETYCPRCGLEPDAARAALQMKKSCPQCRQLLAGDEDACSSCGQLLCPRCQGAVGEDDARCPHCGAEFELACPVCGQEVGAEETVCPHCQTEF